METRTNVTRRDLLKVGLAGVAIGVVGSSVGSIVDARAGGVIGAESLQVAEIYELQAAFHRAKTTADINLMMSLWAADATFTNHSATGTKTYHGSDEIRAFWLGSGSWTHHRFSLVPSFKTTIEVDGSTAFLYFECHDVGEFATKNFGDPTKKTIVNDTYLAGTLRHIGGSWVFSDMTAGSSSPLSYSTYYYPIPSRR